MNEYNANKDQSSKMYSTTKSDEAEDLQLIKIIEDQETELTNSTFKVELAQYCQKKENDLDYLVQEYKKLHDRKNV
jgi:hypothetical protein